MIKSESSLSPLFLLLPSQSQKEALKYTIERFNLGCQTVRDLALEKDVLNKIALQPIIYRRLREDFGLPSQMSVRAIGVGVELAKAHIQTYCPHWRSREKRSAYQSADVRPPAPVLRHAPMVVDNLIASFPNPFAASIRTIHKREHIPMMFCRYAPRTDIWPFPFLICDDQYDTSVFWIHLSPSRAVEK